MKKVAVKKAKAGKKKAVSKKATVKKNARPAPKAKVSKAASKAKAVKAAPKAEPKPAAPADLPEVVRKAVQFLDDKKAENIVILDLRGVANISDYFVVATAANVPHLKSLSDGLQRLCKNEQYEGYRTAGTGDSGWVIVDYDGVMVHVFSFEMRNLYDLEKLWKDAPRITL